MIKILAQMAQWIDKTIQRLAPSYAPGPGMEKPVAPKMENRVNALVDRLGKESRLESLEQELLKMECHSLHDFEKERWHFFLGCSAFQRGDHALAMSRFKQGSSEFPESGDMLFCLGQEHEHVGDIEEMLRQFDKAKFPAVSGQYALTQARYAYLWDRHEKTIAYLWHIWEAYHKLGIVDDTFLYLRGLPFFNHTWGTLAVSYIRLGRTEEFMKITKKSCRKLKEDTADYLLFLESYRTGDSSPFIEYVKNLAKNQQEFAVFRGYRLMQLAVLESQRETDLTKAGQILDSVKLSEKDFKWLEDIRLMAQCELSCRRQDQKSEEILQARFMQKQTLLFEPHHLFDFHLLDYNEKLRPLYQRTKKPG